MNSLNPMPVPIPDKYGRLKVARIGLANHWWKNILLAKSRMTSRAEIAPNPR